MTNLKTLSFIVAILASMTSCVFANTDKSKDKKVPYTVANRYFVNNTVKDGVFFYPKITSNEEFDKLFGMATVMGKNGQPTPIDFSKQYVIAIIDATTNSNVKLTAKSLTQNGNAGDDVRLTTKKYATKNINTITFNYSKTEEKTTSTAFFRHCLIIIVDKKYDGDVKIFDDQQQEKIPFTLAKRYFVNNTVEDGTLLKSKITSQEEFDKLFGMAAVMGEDGQPTPIDFANQYVIAVIDPTVNKRIDLTVESLDKKEGIITLTYQRTEASEAESGEYRHCMILIVDKKYEGEVKIIAVNN